jgi:outer membrane lipoprotein-sorting protein
MAPSSSIPCGVLIALLMFCAPVLADPEASAEALRPGSATAHTTEVPTDTPAAASAAATASCVEAVIDAVQRRYESIDRMRADFTQLTRSAALPGSGTQVGGTVTFAKPGKMHWQYRNPDSSMISDGSTLWIFDPAFGEAQKLAVGREYLSGASIQFLLGQGDMRRDFRIVGLECTAEQAELELSPVSPASYERLQIRADPGSGDLLRTTVFDLLGNVTEVEFSNLQTGFELDPGLFEFVPPPGVRVIELNPDPG